MNPNEEYYLKIRNKLDDLGYLQPLSYESVLLVDKILEDLLNTKKSLQHYKNVAQQSMEACSELQAGVGPYRVDNAKLIKENNDLRLKLLKAREAIEDTRVELKKEIRRLEKEHTLQEYLCAQHASKISQLQAELARKAAKLQECRGVKCKQQVSGPGTNRKREELNAERDQMLEKAQETINNLTKNITKLKSEQEELDEVIENLKNKVNARDAEVERLTQLLAGGRPLMAARNQCPCCSPQLLDCRLLSKNRQLSEQLEETKQKQHEAMIRAMELAEKNQILEEKMIPSARTPRSDSSKKCCCAENSNKICKLQEKLEDRILQVEKLEQELAELKRTHANVLSDKLSVDKILEITLEDKKRMHDRINELTIIEHDLMLEIERLRRTNSSQKSQLAELEARITRTQQVAESIKATDIAKSTVRPGLAKPSTGPTRSADPKRPGGQTKKVILRPVPVARTKARPPPGPRSQLTSSTSPSPQPHRSPSPPTDWKEQLLKERKQFEQQIKQMEEKQAEHCAKFHPPPCPQSTRGDHQALKEGDAQRMLLERIQAERDYYHKEFTRLRDQLCNIPDHSTEMTNGVVSPHKKLERLLSERDCYYREMCRQQDAAARPACCLSDLERQLEEKQDEINVLEGKVADLQHKFAASQPNVEVWKKISDKEDDIRQLSEKIRQLEQQMASSSNEDLKRRLNLKEEEILHLTERLKNAEKNRGSHDQQQNNEDLKRRLNLKEEEILHLTERLKNAEKNRESHDQQQNTSEVWRKLNLKEEENLTLREKIRALERNHTLDFTQTNAELWRKINLKEDELLRMQDKIRFLEQNASEFAMLKRKYNQKEEENLALREQIREYECNRCNSNGLNQGLVTRLEMERDAAKGDCVRLREEINTLRNDLQRLKDCQLSDQLRLEQAQKDFDCCVAQFEVERRSLTGEIKQLTEELRQIKDKTRELQAEAGEHRTRCNHLKLVNEQTERELQTTQDLLHQTEAELASALDRVQELNEETKQQDWELKEARQERTCLKANMARLDQERDSLLIKVDEKTEQNVRLEGEVESRSCRIANLEAFIADLQKKLDVALDTAARSEQTSRQHSHEMDRLQKELGTMERKRDTAVKENSRLQDDLASVAADNQKLSRSLDASRREVEDLKLQLQQYVAEVRRVTQMQEEREAERVALLEQFRSLTAESATLENKHHSLESEAKSTKSCLREAQTRIHDLESCLAEKKALVHGYEVQIRELTQQVAKLERKVNSQSRAESASRDVSRELESQKHCFALQVEQVSCQNRQLEEEVCQMRSEMDHLREQLSKERKNSATLENVLASSRHETLQRTRDNSELKTQVQSLQSKLTDLQDKLDHGSEALRRCQGECAEYQAQVCDLRREVTNQRFERARMEQTGRSRRRKRAATHHRSRSLQHNMSSHICSCCFLNRISSLRRSNHLSAEQLWHKSVSGCGRFNGDSREFMFPERLVTSERLKSGANEQSVDELLEDPILAGDDTVDRTEMLAHQISLVLEEQMKFVQEFNLPINNKVKTGQISSKGDCFTQNVKTVNKHKKVDIIPIKKQNIDKKATFTTIVFASGDQDRDDATLPGIVFNIDDTGSQCNAKSIRPTCHFNEEPVKIPKAFELKFSKDIDIDINKNSYNDKNMSVKMLFSPKDKLICSSSSFGSQGTESSVFVTAANSLADSQALYTSSSISLCKTTSELTHLKENN